jgi:hypothetical protein
MDRPEALTERPVGEAGPARRGREVLGRHGLTGGVAIQPRALVGLELEEFEDLSLFAGRCHDPEPAVRVGEQDARWR